MSTAVGIAIGCALAILWATYAWLTITERAETLTRAEQNLAGLASAYGEHASTLMQFGVPLPVDEAHLAAGAPAEAVGGAGTLADYRHALNIPGVHLSLRQTNQADRHDQTPVQSAEPDIHPDFYNENGLVMAVVERPHAGLVVTASMSEDLALAEWQERAIIEASGALIISLVAGLLGALLVRQLRHREVLETKLIAGRDAAEAGSRAKSDFLANMSHEIRTPMNGVLGMTGLLLDTPLNDEQRKHAEVVRESGEALLAIVNDILDVSKLEAGKFEIESIDFDMLNTVESAISLMAGKAREKGVDLGAFVAPAARGVYRGDPARLRQVLLNLLSNAIKFTDRGGVSVMLEVHRVDDPASGTTHLRFEVKDTGVGIPEKTCERLFQKFSQADSSVTRRYGGTGLGLAICKQLVELMGGRIGVSSRVGMGSTFWFELALVRSTARVPDMQTLPEHLKLLKVLLVDDVAMNLEILGRQLSTIGIKPTGVADAFAALAELERAWHQGKPFDVVFLDQMMPGMAGEDLAARIRANPSLNETKLVLVSSAGTFGLKKTTAALLDARVDKPVRQHELLDCLVRVYSGTESEAKSASAPRQNAAQQKPPSTRALRVLLAEDNKINQKFAVALLWKAGHKVDIVENGNEAVDAVRRSNYDVVLMDIQMPELDGVGATREIRALPRPKCAVPIIAMTANAMQGAREEYLKAGMDDYVPKPIQPELLFAKLARIGQSLQLAPPPAPPASAGSVTAIAAVPAPAHDVLPALNLDKMAELQAILPGPALREFLTLYLTDTEGYLAHINDLNALGDLPGIGRDAHVLVGTAGNMGVDQVCATARSLEHACRKGDRDLACQLVEELNAASVMGAKTIRSWMAATAPVATDRAETAA